MSVVAVGIDPRDTNWEQDQPTYRVYFHDENGASDEWQLTDVDSVHTVVGWAENNASGRTFVVYVEVQVPPGTGLIRLVGRNPNEM
ncbi:hypothetical protein K2F54_18875 [Cryobacterium sp. 1639]|jgi:hypothetical protein|uniref:hypothetical protein n=1 Tax=Cryobacterium inferilacus TaxID=2866629 RepID=UPI001C7321EA|nr:hypothetical protein [Cryobacterium sp. 1639]MBX0302025.1 hypothetical protein [Cryobacterium sp. 1639]